MLRTKRTFLSSILVSPLAFSRVAAGRNAEPPQAGGGAGEIDAAKFPSLQAALDAVPEAGGVVRLPPGEFELTRPLVLSRERTRLTGSGDATRLLNVNESGEPAILIRHPKRASETNARLWGIQLEGFRISGNPKSGDGLFIEGGERDRAPLSDDRAPRRPRYPPGTTATKTRVWCIEHHLQRKAGLNIIRCHDIVVSGNQFEENQDALRCIDSFNLCMTGNNIDDHLRHGVVIENTYGSVVVRQHDRGVQRRRPSSSTATATASR